MTRSFAVLLLLCGILVVSCARGPAVHTQTGETQLETIPTPPELVARSELIVAGTVSGQGDLWNMARGSDPTTPSKTNIVLAQNFTVHVDRTLKGAQTLDVTVAVAKAYGVVGVGQSDDPQWLPPKVGVRYLWFLVRIPGTDVYGQPGEPYRFVLTTEARVESRWATASQQFPAMPSTSFMNLVTTAVERP